MPLTMIWSNVARMPLPRSPRSIGLDRVGTTNKITFEVRNHTLDASILGARPAGNPAKLVARPLASRSAGDESNGYGGKGCQRKYPAETWAFSFQDWRLAWHDAPAAFQPSCDAMQTSFSQWIDAVKKHWFLSFLVFAATIALTVAVVLYYPRVYRSQAKLLLRVGRESVSLDPTASSVGDKLNLLQTREHEMQTAIGVMHSATLIERVVDHVGPEMVLGGELEEATVDASSEQDSPPGLVSGLLAPVKQKLATIDPIPDRERAMRALRNDINISAPSESSVVSIEYRAKSPEAAQAVVNAWLDNYLSLHVKVNRTQGTYEFFAEQDGTLKQELETAREQLRAVKSDSNLVTIEGQQKLLENQLSTLRGSLLEVEGELAATQSRVRELSEILAGAVEPNIEEVTGKANESLDEMRAQLFEMETLEKDLASKLKEGHPKLEAIQRQLAQLQEIFGEQQVERDEVTRTVNPAYQRMLEESLLQQASLEALAEKKKALLVEQTDLLGEIALLNTNEKKVRSLMNDVQILEARYARHAEKLEQARLDDVLEQQRITSVNIVQPASLEHRPVTPDKKFCAIFGVFAALLGAVGFPLLLHTWKLHSSLIAVDTDIGGNHVVQLDLPAGETSSRDVGVSVASNELAEPVAATPAATVKPR